MRVCAKFLDFLWVYYCCLLVAIEIVVVWVLYLDGCCLLWCLSVLCVFGCLLVVWVWRLGCVCLVRVLMLLVPGAVFICVVGLAYMGLVACRFVWVGADLWFCGCWFGCFLVVGVCLMFGACCFRLCELQCCNSCFVLVFADCGFLLFLLGG